MKETNLEVVSQTAYHIIIEADPSVGEFVPIEQLSCILTNIYMNCDTSKALTNHVKDGMTIITSEKTVSVIWDEWSTTYRLRQPLCLYEDLVADLETILSCIDMCVNRLIDQ